jgi:hypothetical protein
VVQNRHNRDVFLSWLGIVFVLPSAKLERGIKEKEDQHTRTREVRRHADDFQAGCASVEFVKLHGILLRNAGPPGPGRRSADARDMRSREHCAVRGEAGEGAGANTEEGEEKEARMLCAVIAAQVILLIDSI